MATVLILIACASLLWLNQVRSSNAGLQLDSAYAQGDWDKTATLARARLKETPGDMRALRMAARAAARQDQDQKAIAFYERLHASSKEAEDFFLIGRAFIRGGKFEQALQEFEAARHKEPDHPEALAALAGLYLQSDRNDAAVAIAQRLARQPRWEARAQLLLGTARSANRDPMGAAEALRRWAELDPQGRVVAPHPASEILKLLARSWLEAGRPEQARTVLETLLDASPDAEASWLLSRCFIQQRDWKQAAAVLQERPNFRAEHPLVPEPAPYVGEARCAECHREEFRAVLDSRHATTFARAAELGSLALPEQPLHDPGAPTVTHRLSREDGSLVVETRANQKIWRAVVDYAFGSTDHFTTFVGRDDRGKPRMVRMSSYRALGKPGWDIATGLSQQPADEEDYLGKKMLEGDGVRRCLNCHTTNPHAILCDAGPEAKDHAIGCEQCHGPAGHHVAAVAAGFSDLAIDRPGDAQPAEIDQVCAKCHGLHQPDIPHVPRTDPTWLRFESLGISWSRCFTESDRALGCITCHDPHRNAESSAAWYEAKCLLCHSQESAVSSARPSEARSLGQRGTGLRDRPITGLTGASCPINPTHGCVDCHLPRIWVQSTHSFKADHFIRIRGQTPSEPRPAGSPVLHGRE
jgi:tetratricopeptide (TPR) repeat protein